MSIKSGVFMTMLLAIWGCLKLVGKLIKSIVQVTASLVIFLGLYVPLFYVFLGLILLATTDFTFGGTGTAQIVYYIGLGLSCVIAIAISIKNLLVKPISSVFKVFHKDGDKKARYYNEDDDYYEEQRPTRQRHAKRGRAYYYNDDSEYARYMQDERANKRPRSNHWEDDEYEKPYTMNRKETQDDYYATPRENNHYWNEDNYRDYQEKRIRRERPLVYYSKRRPDILVKEYSDRFELFTEKNGVNEYVGTEYKDEFNG